MRTRGRPRATAREQARAGILSAARRIITLEGWTALKHARIAKESGYNPALIGYYFGTMARLREELHAAGVVETKVKHDCRCEVCQRTMKEAP